MPVRKPATKTVPAETETKTTAVKRQTPADKARERAATGTKPRTVRKPAAKPTTPEPAQKAAPSKPVKADEPETVPVEFATVQCADIVRYKRRKFQCLDLEGHNVDGKGQIDPDAKHYVWFSPKIMLEW